LSSSKIVELSKLKIKDADYRIFVEPIPDLYAEDLTNGEYERMGHHDSHCYGAYFTSGMDGKVISISYDGGGDKSVMKIYLCEDEKMTLFRSMDFSTFGSLSHLWGFSTMGMMGWNDYGAPIWKICKDEGKLMGMAADGAPPAAHVVDVAVSIHIPGISSLHPVKHDRLAADRFERPHRGVHPTGHQALGRREDLVGAGGVVH
jgi:predicted NodU family carbamoyl transferase